MKHLHIKPMGEKSLPEKAKSTKRLKSINHDLYGYQVSLAHALTNLFERPRELNIRQQESESVVKRNQALITERNTNEQALNMKNNKVHL